MALGTTDAFSSILVKTATIPGNSDIYLALFKRTHPIDQRPDPRKSDDPITDGKQTEFLLRKLDVDAAVRNHRSCRWRVSWQFALPAEAVT